MSQITRESEIYFSKVIYDGPLYTIVPLYSTLVLTHTMINSKYIGLKMKVYIYSITILIEKNNYYVAVYQSR